MAFGIQLIIENTPVLGNAGFREKSYTGDGFRPLILPESFRITPPRIDLPENPIGFDWRLSLSFVEQVIGDEGSFWARIDNLQNFLIGKEARIRWGDDSVPTSDWTASRWIVRSLERGIGKATLTFETPIRKVMETPTLASRDYRINTDVTSSATSIPLIKGRLDPDVPNGHYCLGSEVVEITATSVNTTSGVTTATVSRGQLGTPADAHEKDTTLSPALHYDDENPVDVARELLENAGVGDWVDETQWNAERDAYIPDNKVSGVVCEPGELVSVLTDLMNVSQMIMYSDPFAGDGDGRIKVTALSVWLTDSADITLAVTDDQSRLDLRRNKNKQWTRAVVDGSRSNWTESDTSRVRITFVDAAAESEEEYNISREFRFDTEFLQTTIDDARTDGEYMTRNLVTRFRDPPYILEGLRVNPDALPSGQSLDIGAVVAVTDKRLFQTSAGDPSTFRGQIISARPQPNKGYVDLSLMEYVNYGVDVGDIEITQDTYNLNLYERFLRPTEAINVTVTIKDGAILGSTSTATPAFDTGALHKDSVIDLVIEEGSAILGRGGNGGRPRLVRTGVVNLSELLAGDGGTAVNVSAGTVNIENDGVIGGGGGGGGGLGFWAQDFYVIGSGGGGAGFNVGGSDELDNASGWRVIRTPEDIFDGGGAPTLQIFVSPPPIPLIGIPPGGTWASVTRSVGTGAGGALGMAGADQDSPGTQSYLNLSLRYAPDSGGGAAGAAIVTADDATLTYKTKGDLRGSAPA